MSQASSPKDQNQDQESQSLVLSRESHRRALSRIEWLERWLENAIEIPGIRQRIGLDALVGLIPVAGDCVTGLMSLYLIWEARRFKLKSKGYWKMLGNVAVDLLIGLLPVVGDYADFTWRANSRNLKIIKEHLRSLPPASSETAAKTHNSEEDRPDSDS